MCPNVVNVAGLFCEPRDGFDWLSGAPVPAVPGVCGSVGMNLVDGACVDSSVGCVVGKTEIQENNIVSVTDVIAFVAVFCTFREAH